MTSHVPVSREERLDHVDLVRGYALIGVLWVNMHGWFRGPPQRYWTGQHPYPQPWNIVTDHLTHIWFAGKSVTLFSMLFALGLCIQYERATAKDVPWGRYALRRLGSLLLFGVLHIVLVWYGDILHLYALVGLLILPFLKRERRTIGYWVLGTASALLLLRTGQWIWNFIQHPTPPPLQPPVAKEVAAWIDASVQGYRQPSWLAVLRFRVRDYIKVTIHPATFIFWGTSLLNFLFGIYAWKHGAVRAPKEHLPLLRRVAGWALGLGVLANVIDALRPSLRPFIIAHWSWARYTALLLNYINFFSHPVMAIGLGATLIVLWYTPPWRERLRPLTYVGRMAFTNYITQSLVCTAIFYGWGLGYYDHVSPLGGTAIVVVLYGLQIPLSRWWLSRFYYGPLEWLWRCLTYGTRQPFRKNPGGQLG